MYFLCGFYSYLYSPLSTNLPNRKCIIEQFPLTSLSIGVVVADPGRFHNILEIGEVGAQVKHAAKSVMGSSYAVDRRKKISN